MVTSAQQKAYQQYYTSRAAAQKEAEKQAALAAPYLQRSASVTPQPTGAASWGQARNNITTSGMGANRPSNPKTWESMTAYEKKAALDAVPASFWAGGGSGSDKPSTPSTPSTPTPAEEVPKTTMPVDLGTPVVNPAVTSNVDATSQLYADALKALQDQYGVSQENINAAIARMEADPYNRANAYAQMQLAPARVAADPLAQYMAAAGLSDQQSAANAQLAQAEADAYQQAMRNVQNVLQQSQEQANLSRLADIGLIRTGAQQDLESNLNMLRLGLDKERIGALTGLQQRNLENQLNQRNAIANQIANIFSGQDVAPESILKLIEAALAKTNMNRWTDLPMMGA